ncbi:hypothetical protein [Streptomyces sp. NBC_00120]|uniref:hypothetical protein n=1 Tax=Streptomyces sp. NBC_00120 TaxID=2975660 RepID=UPI002B1D3F9C|nr:hypothetical protein [Streptomyces sp. NBC_00120]
MEKAIHKNPGQDRTCCNQNGAPARSLATAANISNGPSTNTTVPARRARPARAVVSRTRRRHAYRCRPAKAASEATPAITKTAITTPLPPLRSWRCS